MALPEPLQRAVSFIESHVEADIGLHDIAEAAGTSPRALQYAFRRHLGTTPLTYLRRLRLDRVRRELLTGGRDTTVAAVATRWFFYHLGRFAAAYKAAYGEMPHDTLRRRT